MSRPRLGESFFSTEIYSDQCLRIHGERFYGAVSLLDEDSGLGGFIPMCDGFLGMDLFRDYAIEINPDEKVFRVYDRVPESIVQMSDFVLRLRNQHMVELDLNKAGRTLALLDTGSDFGITLEQNIFDKLVARTELVVVWFHLPRHWPDIMYDWQGSCPKNRCVT